MSTIRPSKTCGNCRFYTPYVNGAGQFIYGICNRLPPTSQRVPARSTTIPFPTVFEWVSNWPRPAQHETCGEFKHVTRRK